MKFVFVGTSVFAQAILEKLMSDFFFPEFVITQPDKPAGRKQALQAPPVKHTCIDHNISFFQPEKISELEEQLKSADIDFLIVAAYGQIIPKRILDIPKKGAINVHGSLLPLHRGASPIQASILAGDEKTGITIMSMDEKMDHGDIIHKQSLSISATDTYQSLHAKLALLGADVLCKVLPDYFKGKLKATPQNHDLATFTSIIKKEDAKIDWSKTDSEVDRMIRAYYEWPIAWTELPTGKRMKIYHAELMPTNEHFDEAQPGTIIITDNQLYIATGNKKALIITDMQVEGKKRISMNEFIQGYNSLHGKQCK